MARRTKKSMLAARQDPAAPYLFDEDQMPIRDDVVELVKQGHHAHTGQRLLENEKLCQRMVELLMCKWGMKRISRELGVSRHTVVAARDALVARGEMAPYKERVISKMGEIVEAGLDKYLLAVEEDKVAPATLPVGVAVIADKRALALGEPTSIGIGAQVTIGAEISVEKIQAWMRSIEARSDVLKQIPAISEVSPPIDAHIDARKVMEAEGSGVGGERRETGE